MKKVKNLDLIIILASILVIGLILSIVLVTKPFAIKNIEDIQTVTVENYNKMSSSEEEYFVLLYDAKSEKANHIKDTVIEYAEYAGTHSNAPRIYILRYDELDNKTTVLNASNFNIAKENESKEIPCLGVISKSQKVTSKKTTISTICDFLEDYIIGKK